MAAASRGARARWKLLRRPTDPRLLFLMGTLIVFVAGWNADIADTTTGLDAGWQAGLYMAVGQGLNFGQDIAFTYGPLGFLKYPASYDTGLAAIAFTYVTAVELLTAALLVWAAHLSLGRWRFAILAAAAATSILAEPRIWEFGGAAPVHVLAFVACAQAMRDDAPQWLRAAVAGGGGVMAGIEVLAKVNTGLLVAAMILFTLAVVDRRATRFALFGATFLLTAALGWLLTGQSAAAVDDYLRMSFEIVRGWPLAMGSTDPIAAPVVALCVVSVALVMGGIWVTTERLRLRTRLSIGAMAIVLLLGIFKYAFVSDGSHNFFFFATVVAAWFGLRWDAHRRLGAAVLVSFVAIYLAAAALLPLREGHTTIGKVVGVNVLNQRPTSLLDTKGPDAGRAKLRRSYQVSAQVLRTIGDRPVHIVSLDTSVAWAYRMNWRPTPVFQPNMVTTAALDRLNASVLRSPAGPQRLLQERGVGPFSQPPATLVAMVCHFRHLSNDSHWEVAGRVPNQCGRRRLIRRLAIRPGQDVPVPHVKGALTVASIHGLEPGALEVAGIGFVPRVGSDILVDGRAFNLERGTAGDGMLLRVPPGLDYPRPFQASPQARSISVRYKGDTAASGLSLEFYAVPARPTPTRG